MKCFGGGDDIDDVNIVVGGGRADAAVVERGGRLQYRRGRGRGAGGAGPRGSLCAGGTALAREGSLGAALAQAQVHEAAVGGAQEVLRIGQQPRTQVVEEEEVPFEDYQGHGEKILVVDDDPSMRLLVADILEDTGYMARAAYVMDNRLAYVVGDSAMVYKTFDAGRTWVQLNLPWDTNRFMTPPTLHDIVWQDEANGMIVAGFIEPFVKELPMEYAIEMNRLIQLQMEGSIG